VTDQHEDGTLEDVEHHDDGHSFFDDPDPRDEQDPRHRGRPRRRRVLASCLVVLVILAALAAAAVFAVGQGIDRVKDLFAGPPDYSGDGTGQVLFEVRSGDSTTTIGTNLEDQGIVKSVDAFTEKAADDAVKAQGIQVGFYEMKKKMSAEAAFAVLADPGNLVQSSVTIPEGLRVEDTLKTIAKKTDISLASLKKAVRNAKAIGLPSYAKGNAEGYLFPATYPVPANADATSVLSSMVARWRQAADEADLEGNAQKLGYTPGELMTVASLVEAEANRDQDRGKVARVIYNRLETDATNHLLQIDATVNYALGRDLGLSLTQQDLQVDSPYNTRKYPGLPPGPIESPGDAAIAAATDPTPGDWIYYVTVNLDTGETKFSRSYDQFLQYRQELKQWCSTSDRC
jgi:UPF0755 protein